MRSLLRASKGKLINAQTPAKQKSPPGREEEPTKSQVSSFIMEAIIVTYNMYIACKNATRAGSEEGRLFSQASFSVKQMERFQTKTCDKSTTVYSRLNLIVPIKV